MEQIITIKNELSREKLLLRAEGILISRCLFHKTAQIIENGAVEVTQNGFFKCNLKCTRLNKCSGCIFIKR